MRAETAAALRALEQKWRENMPNEDSPDKQWVKWYAHRKCADELAAVLTQEGTDIPVPYELLHELWAHCDLTQESGVSAHRQAGELLRPFHEARGAEPRAASDEPDGFALVPREYTDAMLEAGIAQLNAVRKTLGKYLSDETLCGVVFDGMVSARHIEAAAPDEPLFTASMYGSPAAAAVPAGGDDIPPPMKLRTLGTGVLKTDAPRGGVTEALTLAVIDAYIEVAPLVYQPIHAKSLQSALEAALSPAAQAQDAGELR